MKKLLFLLIIPLLSSCMKWEYGLEEEFNAPKHGLFIINEGNFQYGNSTLSFYNPETKEVKNEVFFRANAMKLGDVAQSMTISGDIAWIVVNNSHVVFAINTTTFKEVGRIINLTSPRYIHLVSKNKAYITQLWDNRIFIVNPSKLEITGYINCPNMTMENGSTEQMVQKGKYVYVNCWSYHNKILKIDTDTDKIVGELEVGVQPSSLVIDANGKLWTITDGGFENSPFGYDSPTLMRIDPDNMSIEEVFYFSLGDSPSEIKINGDGTRLYWINKDIWEMDINANSLPDEPFLEDKGTLYYGLTICPFSGDVYIADAIDYIQQGKIYRYDSDRHLIDEFYTGIIPGSFCWK